MDKILVQNKKAEFDYQIEKKYEAGIVLKGHEVKSIKNGQISLRGSFGIIKKNKKGNPEIWLLNCFITPYQCAGKILNYDPSVNRKLLFKKEEINSLIGKIKEKGLTIVPLKVYTKNNLIKIEIGLGKGRKKFEKKTKIKERETRRTMNNEI